MTTPSTLPAKSTVVPIISIEAFITIVACVGDFPLSVFIGLGIGRAALFRAVDILVSSPTALLLAIDHSVKCPPTNLSLPAPVLAVAPLASPSRSWRTTTFYGAWIRDSDRFEKGKFVFTG
jgi:hypothetical protein